MSDNVQLPKEQAMSDTFDNSMPKTGACRTCWYKGYNACLMDKALERHNDWGYGFRDGARVMCFIFIGILSLSGFIYYAS